jgi:glucosylceramidase
MRLLITTPDAPARTCAAVATTAPADLALDGARHQTWEGWGGCFNELGSDALALLPAEARAEIMHGLFHPQGELGLTIGRVPMGANDYSRSWYSLDEEDGDFALQHFSIERDRGCLIPYIQEAERLAGKRLSLFASPWSPPTWMKRPRAMNYGTLVWEPRYLDCYARYFLNFVREYRAAGLCIDQVHVQNEPNSDQKFPSCLWSGAQFRDFIRDHLGPVFRAAGEATEIWAGTIEREGYHAWAAPILDDPDCRARISGMGFQWAGKGLVRRVHEAWPELRLWQTENECGDGSNSWEHARHVADLIHHYVSSGVSAYNYWNMVLEPEGRSTWGWKQNALVTVDPQTRMAVKNPEWHVFRHARLAADPGAVRLGLRGSLNACTLAFANPDGSTGLFLNNPGPARRVVIDIGRDRLSVDLPAAGFATVRG